MIPRYITSSLQERIQDHKIHIIYGPRQAGKTTLIKYIQAQYIGVSLFLTGDTLAQIQWLLSKDTSIYERYLGDTQLLIIDEAQMIPDIGIILKILYDHFSTLTVIATGSSSFELAQKTQEPLTGRKWIYHLFPLAIHELYSITDTRIFLENLSSIMSYGLYPEVYTTTTLKNKQERLEEITHSYLFKDVLIFEGIKKSQILIKLTKMLAYQIGKPVSSSELANKLGISIATVEKYLTILEQAFIIFRLGSFSNNKRKEVSKSQKYYFWDIGIRNALIESYQDMDIRADKGEIWENIVIAEMFKKQLHSKQGGNYYFWRSYDDQEIDLIYEHNQIITAFEIKFSAQKVKFPNLFCEHYPQATTQIIHRENLLDILCSGNL